MRHVPFVAAVLSVGAAALILSLAPRHTVAQAGTPSAADQGFVGAWRLTFETPVGPSQSLLTVMAEGTVLFSGLPVKPAAEGAPVTFVSAGHGAWRQTSPTTAEITWEGFVTDVQGNFLAIATDSVQATLTADENAWSGPYRATVVDPSGTLIYEGGATVQATRITVQPLATPVTGTPAAPPD
jgi:hypothetical protein